MSTRSHAFNGEGNQTYCKACGYVADSPQHRTDPPEHTLQSHEAEMPNCDDPDCEFHHPEVLHQSDLAAKRAELMRTLKVAYEATHDSANNAVAYIIALVAEVLPSSQRIWLDADDSLGWLTQHSIDGVLVDDLPTEVQEAINGKVGDLGWATSCIDINTVDLVPLVHFDKERSLYFIDIAEAFYG